MRPRPLLLLLVLVLAPLAHAAEPKEFVAPRELSEAEMQRMKEESRTSITRYGKDVGIEPEPFPWMAVGLGLIVISVMGVIGWRVYQSTAREMAETGPDAPPRRGAESDDG